MNITIIPQRIREIRDDQNMTRAVLAERSKVHERTIARIEGEKGIVRENTAKRLAQGLGTKLAVLKGEEPYIPKSKPRDGGKTKMKLDPGLQVLFDLIEERYKVRESELISLAPLLFTILAEASIIWHRQRNQKLNAAMGDLHDIDLLGPLHHADENTDGDFHGLFASAYQVSYVLQEIDEASLFSDVERRWNPFAAYLNHFTKRMREDDVEIGDDKVKNEKAWNGIVNFFEIAHPGDTSDMPVAVLDGLFNKITNGDSNAGEALWTGDVRIREIPRNLFAEDMGKERAKFLAGKLTKKDLRRELGEKQAHANSVQIEDKVYVMAEALANHKGISRAEAEEEARQYYSDLQRKKESNDD